MDGPDIKLDMEQRARAVALEPLVIDDPEWACAAIVWQRDELARLTTERDAAIADGACDACAGSGAPNCMCGGTGKASRAVIHLRERLFDMEQACDAAIARAERAERVAYRFTSVRQKIMEWHELIESEQDLDDSAGDGISVRDVVLKEMEEASDGGPEA